MILKHASIPLISAAIASAITYFGSGVPTLEKEVEDLSAKVGQYERFLDTDLTLDGRRKLPTRNFTVSDALYRAERIDFVERLEAADSETQKAMISENYDGNARVVELFYDYPFKAFEEVDGVHTGVQGKIDSILYKDGTNSTAAIYISNESVPIELSDGSAQFGNTIQGDFYRFRLNIGQSVVRTKGIETSEQAERLVKGLERFAENNPDVLLGKDDVETVRDVLSELGYNSK